nr:hypothetical protein [Tanacetum cinerariifolium]
MQDNAKESCMVSFQLLHSHLKALSNNDLKGTCIEGGFEREFTTLFDQDFQSFTGLMFLNLDQLGKQLDKEEFQEIGLMIHKYFIAYIKTDVPLFHATLIQYMKSLRESILERAKHKREKDRRVKDRMMQSKERKDNSSKALDVGLIVIESNETKLERHVLSNRSGNDTQTDDADINSVNDKQPMAEVHLSTEHNILANEQQHSEQSASVYDTYLLEKVDRNTTPESTDMSHREVEIDQNADVKKMCFNANPDTCITKLLKEVNSRAKIQPNKTRNSNKPVDPTSHTQKPGRKIITGHSFSPNKSSAVHEKTNIPRSCLRWIPTARIFHSVDLKWVPTGKTFTSSTTKVDCEPPNGSNDYITNPYKCDQTFNVSAGTLNLSADQHPCFMIMASEQRSSGLVLNEITPGTISSRLVPTTSPSISYVPPLRNDWDLLFQSMFDELLNPPPSVVN